MDKLKINLRKFWFFYFFKFKSKRLLEVIIYFGKVRFVKDFVEKVFLFNEFFSFVFFIKILNFDSFYVDVINFNLLMDVFILYSEVKNIFCNLDINKVIGVDGIFVRILRDCVEELFYLLVLLFNLLFRCGRVFFLWKRVNVIFVFKLDVKDVVENY